MGVFDQAARYAAQADPAAVPARLLAGAGRALAFREWLDTRTIPLPGGPDRTADLVAALDDPAAHGAPWLLVLEFQAQADADKLDVTLEEVAILRCRARHGPDRAGKYIVATGLVYLRDRCPVEVLDMRLPDGSGTRHAPRVWNVGEDHSTEALAAVEAGSVSWGMLFWVPLMTGADHEAIAQRWKEVVASGVSDRVRRGDPATAALVFAELAGRRIVWKRALEDFDVTESQVLNEWISKAELRAELRKEQQLVLRLLNTRFPGATSAKVAKLITEQESADLLNHWFDAAAAAPPTTPSWRC